MLLQNRIAKKLNKKVVKELGEGSQGTAYLLNDNTVMKVTKQESEYYTSTDLVGKSYKYICKIYATYRVKHDNTESFVIIQEFLDTSVYQRLKDFESTVDTPKYIFNYFRRAINRGFHKKDSKKYVDVIKKNKAKYSIFKWEFEQYQKIAKASVRIGITNSDMFACNIGMRDGHLVLFDLGYNNSHSSSEGSVINLPIKVSLMNKIKKLRYIH